MYRATIWATLATLALMAAGCEDSSSGGCGFTTGTGKLGSPVNDTCNLHATGCLEPTDHVFRYAKGSTFELSASGAEIFLIAPGALSQTSTGAFRAEKAGAASLLLRDEGALTDYVDVTVEEVKTLSLSASTTDVWNYDIKDYVWTPGITYESLLLVTPRGPTGLTLGGLLNYTAKVDLADTVKLETRGRLIHLTARTCKAVSTVLYVSNGGGSTSVPVVVPKPKGCEVDKPDAAPPDSSPIADSGPLLDGGSDAN